jgi:glycosyltransferase involved in cell wall biosynthesis
MPAYLGLIFPSRWQEALPTVVLEALAAGLPVAALQGSSAADVVETLSCGVVVEADYGWAAALACLRASRSALSDRARAGYEANFKPSSWLDEMTRTYEELLNVGHL